jgi:hypothetical protein
MGHYHLLSNFSRRGQANNRGTEVRKREGLENRKHKIVVIGDSYARGCTAELTHNLENTFEVTGYVSPGTGLEVITGMAKKETDD